VECIPIIDSTEECDDAMCLRGYENLILGPGPVSRWASRAEGSLFDDHRVASGSKTIQEGVERKTTILFRGLEGYVAQLAEKNGSQVKTQCWAEEEIRAHEKEKGVGSQVEGVHYTDTLTSPTYTTKTNTGMPRIKHHQSTATKEIN